MNFFRKFFGWNNNQANDKPLFGVKIPKETHLSNNSSFLYSIPGNKITLISQACRSITVLDNDLKAKKEYTIVTLYPDIPIPEQLIQFIYYHNDKYLLCYYSIVNDFFYSNVAIGTFKESEFILEKGLAKIFEVQRLVQTVPLNNNQIACITSYESIYIFSFDNEDNNKPIATLKGHKTIVASILKLRNKEILISASVDYNFIIWNLITYQKECVIKGVECIQCNSMVELEDGKVIVGGRLSIKIINVITKTIEVDILNGKIGTVARFCEMSNNIIICGCSDGMIWKYNRNTKELTKYKDLNVKTNVENLIKINENRFITLAPLSTIKVYDL